MLESVEPRAAKQPSYDDRTLALADSSCRILTGLGLWGLISPNATPIRKVIVRELDGSGRVELDPSDHGLDQFGNIVEARSFGAAMMKVLPGLESLQSFVPATVSQLEIDDEAMRTIHGRWPDGRVVRGVDVFRAAYEAVGWGGLWSPTRLPIVREVIDAIYRVFARRRYLRRMRQGCPLPPLEDAEPRQGRPVPQAVTADRRKRPY